MKPTALFAAAALAVASSAFASPPLSDAIKRYEPVEYQLTITGYVTAYQSRFNAEDQYELNLENTPLVFPIIPSGAYHTIDMERLKTTLELDDRQAESKFEILPTAQADGRLARFNIPKFKGKQVEYSLEEFVTCYNAKVDEARLRAIGWPEKWPAEVSSELQQQRYIESTNEQIVQLLEKWTNGKAKSAPPYVLGKELTRLTVQNFQINGKNWFNDELNRFAGLEVQGALKSVEQMRGTSHDCVCLFVAVCRAAGLPARPVIGIQMLDDDRGRDFEDDDKRIISWAEFYVPTAGWIAVDFRPLFKAPGRMHDLNREWPGVGTNDELNLMVPISYHFHPPASVRAEGRDGKPMLWGWQPVPVSVPSDQMLEWKIIKAPKRGGR